MGKTRDRLYSIVKDSKQPEDWLLARMIRNGVNEACKTAKNQFAQEKLEKDQGNPKKFWGHIKLLENDKNGETGREIEFDECTIDKVPDRFNQFFANICLELKKKVKPLDANEEKLLKEGDGSGDDPGGH